MTESPAPADYRALLERALEPLPAGAAAARVWRALGEAGALRELYRDGGPTGPVADPRRLRALLTAVDARGDNGVTLAVLVQAASALPIAASGTAGPVAEAAAAALAGAATLALAATDTAVPGSDLAGLGTELSYEGEELVIDGGKRWVTGAVTADHLLVLARHRPGRHFTSFGWVLVPTAAPGVTVRPAGGGLLAGAGIGHVELRQVRLPAAHLVGRPGRGMALFARHMGTERLAGAYWAVALGSRTVAATVELLERRTVEDRPLWQHPAVRQQLAGCLVALRQLSALADTLAERITAGPDLAAAALLKAAVGQGIDPVLDRCAHLQGAEGFAPGGAQLTRAEAGVLGIGGGVTELMLDAVADGAPALLAELRS